MTWNAKDPRLARRTAATALTATATAKSTATTKIAIATEPSRQAKSSPLGRDELGLAGVAKRMIVDDRQ